MKFLQSFIFSIFFGLLFFAPGSEAVIVLKTKNKQALIHMEGLKTKKGAYFEVIDLYGQKQGILQIKRVARTKAIGVLKYGSMGERWSLEPTSKRKALALMKREIKKRSTRTARIQKEKFKRKLARKKLLKKKRKLVKKKRALRRKLASYEGGEYILDDSPKDSNGQSSEVLSYDDSDPGQIDSDEQINGADQSEDLDLEGVGGTEEAGRSSKHSVLFSIAPRFEYNFIKGNPPGKKPGYLMHGHGFGLFVSADVSLNRLLRVSGSLGVKRSGASAEERQCGIGGGCFVTIYYLSGGLDLKLNLMKFDDHKLWLAGGGVLMQPLAKSNNILTPDSFSPFHGTLGLSVGVDLALGNLIVPVSVRGDFYMPPTKTVMVGTAGLQLGLAYKF